MPYMPINICQLCRHVFHGGSPCSAQVATFTPTLGSSQSLGETTLKVCPCLTSIYAPAAMTVDLNPTLIHTPSTTATAPTVDSPARPDQLEQKKGTNG